MVVNLIQALLVEKHVIKYVIEINKYNWNEKGH